MDADEDHVALQDANGTIVPIIAVCEGTKSLFKGRSQCKNAYPICSYGKAPEDLWEQCESSCKSCAFGQIKQPAMGWSREGLRYMAELRVFKANGGVVGVEHIKTKENSNRLVKKAMKQAKKVFHGINPENIGNIYILNKGKVTSLYRTLRIIQSGNLLSYIYPIVQRAGKAWPVASRRGREIGGRAPDNKSEDLK